MKLKHLEIWLFTILITLFSLYIVYCHIVPKHSEFTIYIPKTTVTSVATERTQMFTKESDAAQTLINNNGLININTASAEDLKELNGIGDVLSQRIIEYRDENGYFQSIEDIMNVRGIGEGIFAKIANNITV